MDTADRYREAGMPPPRGEVFIPASKLARHRSAQIVRDMARQSGVPLELAPGGLTHTDSPLAERVHDPATDGPVLPEIDPAVYGSDSVPLDDNPDADTEEHS